MNVLRKKINTEKDPTGELKEMNAIWRDIHTELSDSLTALTHMQWDPLSVDLDLGDLKTLMDAAPETALCETYANPTGSFSIYTLFDARLAHDVTSVMLGGASDAPDTSGTDAAHELDMLDLLLFKPVQDVLALSLNALLGHIPEMRDPVASIWKGVLVKEFKLPRHGKNWNKVSFTIEHVPEPDDTDTNPEPIRREFFLFVPHAITQGLIKAHKAKEALNARQRDYPWAPYIYKSIVDAPVPLKAVIESCKMTVADCTRLQIGDVIELPGISLSAITVETELKSGPVPIAQASLGIYKSFRALKLNQDIDLDYPDNSPLFES